MPTLVGCAAERHRTAERRLQAAEHTQPAVAIPDSGGVLRRAVTPKSIGRHIWAEDIAAGKREVLRLTGIRCEELLELTYDIRARVWNPPMPLLFQRAIGNENRPYTPSAIRKLLIDALAATELTGVDGEPLIFSPHDFRRIFVTDAIMSGLPPHIAQIICGHKTIQITMGYKAVYPSEVIEAHRAFIARRRATRPSQEYRTPTDEEWDEFLAHFEKRKVSVGTCGRAFGTPCLHEHACVRCALLRPDPAQRPRLEEIRSNLKDRIIEAELHGWRGEAEGLQVSLAGVNDKLAQINTSLSRSVNLGTPTLPMH